ncbi:hypothetical protein D9615_003423 [Tricholomella constricta]|uniref:D-lactate dehydratase n=1 Tax=Tricholomella constricta TaxID=117010 RepID=A0A8H5HIN9_9AGAR|nr:hypothetical protein D9615_003423 [Tricholomella constricta]
MHPSALILIADGTEEMEFTITYDTLVRAGVATTSAFVPEQDTPSSESPPFAKGSRGINIMPDQYLNHDCGPDRYDLLVVPGGAKGADTMSKQPSVQQLVRDYYDKKMVGMICAGSLAALRSGLPRQPLTSHPSVRKDLEKGMSCRRVSNDFDYSEEPVVVSGNLVTSRGPGTAFPFALTLVEQLCGADKRAQVQKPMVFPPGTPF